jgi:ribosomal protein S18 acetylase RimI-like enzyme
MRLEDITIRHELRPGDLGYVIHRASKIAEQENNYGVEFEAYVAGGLLEFYKNYDAKKDYIWVCEHDRRIIGFLLLVHRENNAAQLKNFYLEPEFRGVGLGKKLMNQFVSVLKERRYTSSYLWTTNEQQTAVALYERLGYVLTEEKESSAFGRPAVEQKFELRLK